MLLKLKWEILGGIETGRRRRKEGHISSFGENADAVHASLTEQQEVRWEPKMPVPLGVVGTATEGSESPNFLGSFKVQRRLLPFYVPCLLKRQTKYLKYRASEYVVFGNVRGGFAC